MFPPRRDMMKPKNLTKIGNRCHDLVSTRLGSILTNVIVSCFVGTKYSLEIKFQNNYDYGKLND